jgi:hypothetical protein
MSATSSAPDAKQTVVRRVGPERVRVDALARALPLGTRMRLLKELNKWSDGTVPHVPEHMTARVADDGADLTHWTATVTGPAGSPYEGGVFHIDVTFPANYPVHRTHLASLPRGLYWSRVS